MAAINLFTGYQIYSNKFWTENKAITLEYQDLGQFAGCISNQ